jgi:hypothetical protein
LHRQSTGQGHTLLLSPRQLPRPAPLKTLHAKDFEEFCDPLGTPAPWHVSQPKGNILGHAQMGEERIVLRHIANAPLLGRQVMAPVTVVQWLAIQPNAPGIWRYYASNGL